MGRSGECGSTCMLIMAISAISFAAVTGFISGDLKLIDRANEFVSETLPVVDRRRSWSVTDFINSFCWQCIAGILGLQLETNKYSLQQKARKVRASEVHLRD